LIRALPDKGVRSQLGNSDGLGDLFKGLLQARPYDGVGGAIGFFRIVSRSRHGSLWVTVNLYKACRVMIGVWRLEREELQALLSPWESSVGVLGLGLTPNGRSSWSWVTYVSLLVIVSSLVCRCMHVVVYPHGHGPPWPDIFCILADEDNKKVTI